MGYNPPPSSGGGADTFTASKARIAGGPLDGPDFVFDEDDLGLLTGDSLSYVDAVSGWGSWLIRVEEEGSYAVRFSADALVPMTAAGAGATSRLVIMQLDSTFADVDNVQVLPTFTAPTGGTFPGTRSYNIELSTTFRASPGDYFALQGNFGGETYEDLLFTVERVA